MDSNMEKETGMEIEVVETWGLCLGSFVAAFAEHLNIWGEGSFRTRGVSGSS